MFTFGFLFVWVVTQVDDNRMLFFFSDTRTELNFTAKQPFALINDKLVCWLQIHGLPTFSQATTSIKYLPLALYTACVLWAYSWIPNKAGRPWVRLPEILRIPVTIYVYFIFGWAVVRILQNLQRKLQAPAAQPRNSYMRFLFLLLAMAIYVFQIFVAVLAQYYDVQMRLSTLSFLFDGLFTVCCAVSFVFLDEAFRGYAAIRAE